MKWNDREIRSGVRCALLNDHGGFISNNFKF